MRIAVITTGFAPDEKQIKGDAAFRNIIKELSNRLGIEIDVFALYFPGRNVYNFYNSRVFSFGLCNSRLRKPWIWRECIKTFNEIHGSKRFDIIQSFWICESGYVASLLSRRHRIPHVSVVCGGELMGLKNIAYGSQLKYFQRYFAEYTLRNSSAVVTACEYMNDILIRHSGGKYGDKSRLIPFGADEQMFMPSDIRISDNVIRLINVANTFPVKSHIDLFKAIKLVTEKYESVRLVCTGAYGPVKLQELAAKTGIEKHFEYRGWTEYEELPCLLNSSDIFVLSSLHEAFNMSVLEAAFCGLPVVSTDVGIARDITPHIVKAGDYKSIAGGIIRVIENLETEKLNARNKSEYFRKIFSVRCSVEKYVKLYEELICKNY
jgi:glycosyltransferase involved in cell wall biosynthesis